MFESKNYVGLPENIVLSADTPVEDCNAEEGIRFLYPLPDKPAPGTVFARTLPEWNMLNSKSRICPQCTYLICTDGETQLIKDYVRFSEEFLTAYSRAGEIADLLSDPDDEKAVAAAQRFTETFSADKECLEGI